MYIVVIAKNNFLKTFPGCEKRLAPAYAFHKILTKQALATWYKLEF